MTVSDINAYGLVIGGSLVIILSYFANLLAKRTNIPSVLVLIGMGIAIRQGLNAMGLTSIPFEGLVLELLGTIGLIFIVLEAALDLNLSREKMPLIIRSASVALIALGGSSAAIAAFLGYSMGMPWYEGLVYAIPLSIMSSAIIIPSVSSLSADSKEFMVYESTFSDIFGIMAFYLLLGNSDAESTETVIWSIGTNLLVTLLLAVFVSYMLVYVLQKITSKVKLFLSIAVLLLIYAIQKLLHLSPLVLILIFGLMLNNHRLFFPKLNIFKPNAAGRTWPERLLDDNRMHDLHRDYHLLTSGKCLCHPNVLFRPLWHDRFARCFGRYPCHYRRVGYLLSALCCAFCLSLIAATPCGVPASLHRSSRVDHHPLVLPDTKHISTVPASLILTRAFCW